jgi:Mn2+/Fe2+ NRAMP family transporter
METATRIQSVAQPACLNAIPANAFGPGLLAAASNNDPTTVAVLAIAAATTGYSLGWLVVLIVPMLAVVQALAAGVGAVCKTSLQGAIMRHFGFGWALVVLGTFTTVNVLTLAADVKAGSEALALLTHIPATILIVPFVGAIGWLLVSNAYYRIERYLSLLSVAFICYVGSALMAHVDVGAVLRGVFVPHLTLSPVYVSGAVALLGTTLTGYVYMWESIGVSERDINRTSIRAFEKGAAMSMIPIGLIFIFIFIAGAATLGVHHLPVSTANDMAAALEPLAGPWSATLFGFGLLASAILAVPVLASVTAYVAAHTFGWNGSLNATFSDAKAFYAVVLGSLIAATALAAVPVSLVGMLFWASIAGAIGTPVSLVLLMLIVRDRRVMGEYRASRLMSILGWGVTGIVTIALGALLVSVCRQTA